MTSWRRRHGHTDSTTTAGPVLCTTTPGPCRSPNPVVDGFVASAYDVGWEPGCWLVQRISSPDIAEQSWTVLGADWLPVIPVEEFLAHLTDQRRS